MQGINDSRAKAEEAPVPKPSSLSIQSNELTQLKQLVDAQKENLSPSRYL